ncbi:DNA-binding protein [Clostridium saccharoperbutylacetonicum]|uniref:DNA-binding protein n=1 Tax=Clostridium saccharoperbutylacetonicum TaxID=36745 RepID=UPI0039E9D74D
MTTMLLAVNTLIKYEDGDKSVERILWISPDSKIVFTISIFENVCKFKTRMVEEVLYGIRDGDIKIIGDDPLIKLVTEEDISDKNKKLRNKAWEIVSSIMVEPDIYDSKKRRKLILLGSKKFAVSERVIYKYLQRYFQRGMNKNALLPDFDNCGGKSKEKQSATRKRGRPKQFNDIVGEGINITDDIKRIFRIALNKYYYTNKQNPLTIAYQLMIRDFFSEEFKIQNKVKIPIIKPIGEIPSFNQFKYWFYKERNLKKEILARKSAKKYELQHRAVLGNSTYEVPGNGVYQIDATIADVFLVSKYRNRRDWIIGRPIVYICMDVFSRYITGLYVGLEGPSWNGAMMAIANSTMDKVEFCNEYDIKITEDQWMVKNVVPDTIIADRGEWEGKVAEGLINGLNIKVENTSSFRGDMKAIVERYFKTINEKTKPFIPGFIDKDYKERGSRDYRLDGKLSLYNFTQIMIKVVLHHNNYNWLSNYNRDEMMIVDDIECIPAKLWEWGLKNRAGKLRTVSQEVVMLHLLKNDYALVTGKGIKYKGIFYGCKLALTERWFERARNNGSWKVQISFDSRNMNYIYIKNEDGKRFEKCYLLNHQNIYFNQSLEEIEYLMKAENIKEKGYEEESLQHKVDLMTEIEAIVKQAENSFNSEVNISESNRKRIKGIRESRQIEKMLNRKEEAFELDSVDDKPKCEVISINKINEEDDDNNLNSIDILRKKQKERLHGKQK